jgi:hypothetical protein
MPHAHASDAKFLFPGGPAPHYHAAMPERVITIALTDADWKILRSVQPEPVDWLKRTIRETIERAQAIAGDPPRAKAAGSH